MKNLPFLIGVILLFSCDPVECVDQIIENNTEMDLYLFRISSLPDQGDTTLLDSNSKTSISKVKCAKGEVVISYSAYDSVYITNLNYDILKTYQPYNSGKNIFNVDDTNSWKIESIGKDEKKYVFEITNDDLN